MALPYRSDCGPSIQGVECQADGKDMTRSGLGLGSGINTTLPEVTEENMKHFRTIRVPPEFRNGKPPDTRPQPESWSLLVCLLAVITYYISKNVSILKDTVLDSVQFIETSSVNVGELQQKDGEKRSIRRVYVT